MPAGVTRFHVYTEARHPTGAVAAGHSLTVYDDVAGTQESDIYAAASGGSPLANPYVVPATGIVDFWATVPKPYVVASGDSTPQPMPILVATPSDIGAANPNAVNSFVREQDIQSVLNITRHSPSMTAEINFLSAEPQGSQGVGQICNMGIDPESFVLACMVTPSDGNQDRINIGTTVPNRIHMGGTNGYTINDNGQPFFKLYAMNIDPADPILDLVFPPNQTGSLIRVCDGYRDDSLRLDASGNLNVGGTKLMLSDGKSYWRISVGSTGTLATTLVPENYAPNPSFELDTNSDGTPDNWEIANGNTASPPTLSLVAGRTGGLALRIQYTGVPADSERAFTIRTASLPLFRDGDPMTSSLYAKGSVSGVSTYMRAYNSGYASIGGATAVNFSGSYARPSLSGTCPASTIWVITDLDFAGIGNGDTIDVTIDDCMIEKAASVGTYFDGNTAGHAWRIGANSSTSYEV